MATPTGKFIWYTLNTSDTEAARNFYNSVIGWTTHDLHGDGRPSYTVFEADGIGIGGMLKLDEQEALAEGIPPHWIGYLAVESVDAAADSIARAGGFIHHAPETISGIGRFATVSDPQGAAFIIFKPDPGEQRPATALGTQGHVGWHELHAVRWQTAFPFYEHQFGWTKSTAHDMGAMGIYQLFALGGADVGGMCDKQASMPAPFWLYYFNVVDINQAARRVGEAGGKILNGPHPVPGGSWILQCSDPQGAMFALVAPGA